MENKKSLQVISGNGSELSISPVYDHLSVEKPKSAKEKPTHIVIPKETKKSQAKKRKDDTNKTNEKKEEN